MGTDVQAKTYFSGSYSMRDLNDRLALYHEHASLKNDQYYDSFFTRPAADGYLGCDKEQLRQTILKHDSIFRHQLAELHRLHRRQRDLMNEIKRRELHQHLIPAETSRPSLFLPHIPSSNVKKTCHVSDFPFMDPTFARCLTSGTDSIQSLLSFTNGKNISKPFRSQDTVISKDHQYSESKCNTFQRRLLNLELPADVYMNNKGKQLEKSSCGVSGIESFLPKRNCEVTSVRDVNFSLGAGLSSGCNGDTSRSNLFLRRTKDIVDLNEPIQLEEASVSASVDNLGNITCLNEEISRQDLFVNSKSRSHILSKEPSQSSLIGTNGGILFNNMLSKNEGNHTQRLTYKNEAGQTVFNTNSSCGGVCPEDSPAPFKSLQVEPSKFDKPSSFSPSDDSNREPWRKKKIFGVEISEGNHNQSVVASQTPSRCQLIPQSDATNSEPSSLPPWIKASCSLNQNVLPVRENACISTSFPSNRSSSSYMQSNTKLVSRAEISYQHAVCLGSESDVRQLPVRFSSIGSDFSNSINSNSSVPEQFVPRGSVNSCKVSDCMDAKSSNDMKDVMYPYKFQSEAILQKNPESVDDNPMGGLPWLKAKEPSDFEWTKGMEDSYQTNSHSLQNYSQKFANKNEMGKSLSQSFVRDTTSSMSACDAALDKIKASVCPSDGKILGFSIFGAPQISTVLYSPSSPSKLSCLASDVDGGNDEKDLGHGPTGDQLEVEDLVTEKSLGNFIDLNLCMNEEEAPPVPSLPRAVVKIATTEIDLEAPAVLESDSDLSPEAVSSENKLKSPSELPLDESKESTEELVRVAAEAIIAISSSDVLDKHTDDITCQILGVSSSDSLHWFAEVVSSYNGDLEGELTEVPGGTDGTNDEEFVPDGMDYFEFMTLKLTETEVEECCNNTYYDEESVPGPTVLSKRPRRGQARRGRQRKDFQRDILPGLISLSRYEVTEDLQVLEALFKESGFTWQPILSQRKAAKNGRGRRRLGGSLPSPTPKVVCPPPEQQPIYRELLLDERTLTGWGKRTRRLPRQRCPTDNLTRALKC